VTDLRYTLRGVRADGSEIECEVHGGRIEPGARADLVVVDPEPTPTVTRGFVAGQPVYRAEGSP